MILTPAPRRARRSSICPSTRFTATSRGPSAPTSVKSVEAAGSVEPLGALEAAVFLNRAVNGLHDARAVNHELACAVRQPVRPLLCAVFRVDIDHRLPKARLREVEPLQPEPLNCALSIEMVGEEIAVDLKSLVRHR